jgi:hypothetical protein
MDGCADSDRRSGRSCAGTLELMKPFVDLHAVASLPILHVVRVHTTANNYSWRFTPFTSPNLSIDAAPPLNAAELPKLAFRDRFSNGAAVLLDSVS